MHREVSPARLLRGSLWMLVAGLLFSAMGVLVKLGAREFSATELVFYRSLFGFAVIFPAVLNQRGFLTPYWRDYLGSTPRTTMSPLEQQENHSPVFFTHPQSELRVPWSKETRNVPWRLQL